MSATSEIPLSRVVLIGASGTVGSHILHALLNHNDNKPTTTFEITCLNRPESTFSLPQSQDSVQNQSSVDDLPIEPKVLRASFTPETFTSVFKGQDAVICAAALSTLPLQRTMIEIAADVGVKRFILNEFANGPRHKGLQELQFARTSKLEAEEVARRKVEQTNESFSWSALATGNIIDLSLKRYPPFGFDIPAKKARLIDQGLEHFTASTLPDIGLGVLGILLHPSQTCNRFLHIRSVETTQAQILATFERLMGEKWDIEYARSADLLASGRQKFKEGDRRGGNLDLLVAQLFEHGTGRSINVTKGEGDNGLLGVTEKDVEEIVRDVLSELGTEQKK